MSPERSGRRAALRRLRGLRRAKNPTALLIPVPEADFLHEHGAGDGGLLGVTGLPLHVTVLYPFLETAAISPAVERELAQLAASRPPFEYVLGELDRFPDALYLAASPAADFIALTRAVEARWPTHPPHGGVFDEIKPHLTLAYRDEPPGLAQAVEPLLPIRAIARELVLMARTPDGHWAPLLRCPLGGSAEQRVD